MDNQRIIVIGASAGGVDALLRMAPRLAPDFAAPIVIVLHIGAHTSVLPELLSARGPLPAVFAQTGTVPQPGVIYIGPPDQHVLIEGGRILLTRGPKEHHARPAINPLFRSAALSKGPRAVGVVLTGLLDDGAAGMHAIKVCGGTTVVQDPLEAAEPSMPLRAMASALIDHIAGMDAMTDILNRLAHPMDAVPSDKAPQWLRLEHAVGLGKAGFGELGQIGAPSGFTCPDCGGALFELAAGKPMRFLCHTGHAFSMPSLRSLQDNVAEDALWAAIRALQEKEAVLRRQGEDPAAAGASASRALAEADDIARFVEAMRSMVASASARAPEAAAGG